MVDLPQDTVTALIDSLRAASRDHILPHFRNLDADDIDAKSGAEDLVTIADRRAEAAITADIRRILPDAAVVGEEAVAEDPSLLDLIGTSETCAIIDPIDGTNNFAKGLGIFGVILAVLHQGRVVLGVHYDPLGDDWVMAAQGQGAWFCRPGRDPRRLSGPKARPLAEARGFVPLHMYPADLRPAVGAAMGRFRRATSIMASCHDYRMLAMGEAEFVIYEMAKPWDHSAGSLILSECGAVLSARDGPYDPTRPAAPPLVAGPPEMIDELRAIFDGFSDD